MTHFTAQELRLIHQSDFASFIERAFYELNPGATLITGWYLELLATELEKCRLGITKRLVINLPPRSLKTHCASIALVAWLLGHNPALQIICTSYGQEFADKPARDTRNLMSRQWYLDLFPETRISPGRKVVHDFMTTANGGRMATSVEGVLTGRGADFIIIDDPQKPDDAMSDTRRNSTNQWFDHSLLSRLNDKENGCIILIQQRLHQDDLSGHVLEQGGWTHLSLPAIAEVDETHLITRFGLQQTIIRKAGEVLHPERDALATLQTIRKTIGEYAFQSQYQQEPSPPGGAMVKAEWIRYYEPGEQPGQFDIIFQSWDTANKPGLLNDPSVCVTIGAKGNRLYVLDVFRRRFDYPELKRAVGELARRWSPNIIIIEDKASGTQLIQELQRELPNGIHPYQTANTDKQMRMYAQTGLIESGNFLVPCTATWLQEYLKELLSFPGVKHDDQVDATAQALDWFQNGRDLGFFDLSWNPFGTA